MAIQETPNLKNISDEILAISKITDTELQLAAIHKIESQLDVTKTAYNNKAFPAIHTYVTSGSVKEILPSILSTVDRFLSHAGIKWTKDQRVTFALDIVDMNPTWNLGDIICFLKFVRQNRSGISEMKVNAFITPPQLIRYIQFYEEERSMVLIQKQKELQQENARGLSEALSNNIIVNALEESTPSKINLSRAVDFLSEKTTDGVVAKNKIQKSLHKLQAKKAEEDSQLSYEQLSKKNADKFKVISDKANKLNKTE